MSEFHWLSSDPSKRPGAPRAPDAEFAAEMARLDKVVKRLSKERPQKPSLPFGIARTPFNPLTGKYFAFGDDAVIALLTIVGIGHNVLACSDRDDNPALIAKPFGLRKSTFSGKEIDGVTYTSTGVDARTGSAAGEEAEAQLVTPSYYEGEKIVAFKHHDKDRIRCEVAAGEIADVEAGNYLLEWEDTGAGRWWAVEPEEE